MMVPLPIISSLSLWVMLFAVGVHSQPVTPNPTKSPTKNPTKAPTKSPSTAPSEVPSSAPSMHEAESDILGQAMEAFTDDFFELAILQALDVPIPLMGLSTTEIMGNAGIFAALNFTDFVKIKIGNDPSLVRIASFDIWILLSSLFFSSLRFPHRRLRTTLKPN
jgi:hypothetical protein